MSPPKHRFPAHLISPCFLVLQSLTAQALVAKNRGKTARTLRIDHIRRGNVHIFFESRNRYAKLLDRFNVVGCNMRSCSCSRENPLKSKPHRACAAKLNAQLNTSLLNALFIFNLLYMLLGDNRHYFLLINPI